MRTSAAVCLDAGDVALADLHRAHAVPIDGDEPVLVPATLHVRIGDGLRLWGAPDVVVRVLVEALACAREAEAAGTENVTTDAGGAT